VRPLQFGVTVHRVGSAADFRQLVARADELGYDVFAVADHLGAAAPFSTLAAAAMVSPRLRLRTYVLNAGFWNPALLAREVATLDVVSDGRVEVGLGAGHMKHENDDAGLPWAPLADRVRAMEDLVVELPRRLSDPEHRPRPVQDHVPIMVGAMSPAGLAVAARHADAVGFAGLRQVRGAGPGTFTLASAQETDDRVAAVRTGAAGRPYRSDALLQVVEVGRDPASAAAEIAAEHPWLSAEQVLDTPFVLLAPDVDDAVDQLLARQARYGFDSVTTHQPNLEALGEVIARYRSRRPPGEPR
jgi:probable F420-dependent oxidoreductase